MVVLCVVLMVIMFYLVVCEGCLLLFVVVMLYCMYLCYLVLISESSTYVCRSRFFIDVNEELKKLVNLVMIVFMFVLVVYVVMCVGESNFWDMEVDESF